MDFIDQIQELALLIPKQLDHIHTEEATKSSLVLPFIQALGYNVFSPLEVIPEFTADVGTAKGEKVDYAIKNGDELCMLFECKWAGSDLDKEHHKQLYRYFSVTDSRIAVLTNGIIYRFYSDLDSPNKMDEKPFLEIDMLNLNETDINELKKLTKSKFELNIILSTASDLKYTREIKFVLNEQLAAPTEDFVRFFSSQIYKGKNTQKVIEQFTPIVKKAFGQFITEKIQDRLKSALTQTDAEDKTPTDEQEPETEMAGTDIKDGIETTEEEMESFYIVRAILREVVDITRIQHRDTKSYFGILLDDNNRKPICRLHYNSSQKYITTFDKDKKEEKTPIESLNDIYNFSDRIKNIISFYDNQQNNVSTDFTNTPNEQF